MQSSDYRPCSDEESVCFFIPSKSQKTCLLLSANYSFNFSNGGCGRYKQSSLSPCELHLDGIKCRYNKLSICHSKDLLWCSLNISVFVTFSNAVLKQFLLQMPQISTYGMMMFFSNHNEECFIFVLFGPYFETVLTNTIICLL